MGTQNDNIQDMIKAGRAQWATGAKAGLAKFSEEQAAALRRVFAALMAQGVPLNTAVADLATLTAVSPRNVWRVVKGRSYR